MNEELSNLFEHFGWVVKEGNEQEYGSCADIYAYNEERDFHIIVDDGRVNNYGEVTHIYVNNINQKIFEGIFDSPQAFRNLMHLIGVKPVEV